MNMVRLTGADLNAFLRQVGADPEKVNIHTIRIDQRGDKIAVKVNGGMWSPSIGEKQEPY